MGMPRKEVCPACKHINRDDWAACAKCGAVRPINKSCPSTVGPHPFTLKLNRAEAGFLLHAIQLVIKQNACPAGEQPDAFWKRGIRLKHQIKKVADAK